MSAQTARFRDSTPDVSAAAPVSLALLRRQIEERYPQGRPGAPKPLPSGVEAVDAALEGGLPRGAFCEVVAGRPSCGGQLLLEQWLRAIREARGYAALVDAADTFDPASSPAPLLEHLLWVRCQQPMQALKAADILLRDENFPLVLLDLRACPERPLRAIKSPLWYRLQRLARHRSVWFVAFTAQALAPSCQVRLELTGRLGLDALEHQRAHLLEHLRASPRRRHGAFAEASGS